MVQLSPKFPIFLPVTLGGGHGTSYRGLGRRLKTITLVTL